MIPFGTWVFVIVALVGLTVAMLAKGYGHNFSDWFFPGIGLGCLSVVGFLSNSTNFAMLSTAITLISLASFTVFFKITKPATEANN